MTSSVRTAANAGGLALIILGALLAAMRAPYVIAVVASVTGLALVLGTALLLQRRAEQSLQALADSIGTPVAGYEDLDGAAAAWLRELGLVDFSRQAIRRVTRKSVEAFGGSAHRLEIRTGAGKTTGIEALVLSAPARVTGRLSLRPNRPGERSRAKWIGGAVTTGTALDEHFVIYAEESGAAVSAAASLDVERIRALLRRATEAGGGTEVGLAIAPGRASLLTQDASAEILSPGVARELLEALGTMGGR